MRIPKRILLPLLLCFGLCVACSEAGNTNTVTDTGNEPDTQMPDNGPAIDTTTLNCEYPQNDGETVYFGKVMPKISWKNAYVGDAAGVLKEDFSMEDFYCSPAFDQYNVIIFNIMTEWCPSCKKTLERFSSDDTLDKLEAAGALLIFLEMEKDDYQPPTNEEAFAIVNATAGDVPGYVVGDADTEPKLTVGTPFSTSRIIGSYPSGFIVRRSDMVVISPLSAGGVYLDLEGIAKDPSGFEVMGGNEGPPNCGTPDEETSEPGNNTPAGAGLIESDILLNGGICDEEPDFYSVELPGRMWLLDLSFDQTLGDLDFYLWDTANDTYLLDGNGRRVGSSEIGSDEVFQFCGSASLRVFGYNGATAPYQLGLTDLGPGPCQ